MGVRTTVELSIEGMRCAGCADAIAAALRAVPGVAAADVSDAAGLARVAGTGLEPAALIAAVGRAGYVAAPTGALAAEQSARREGSALLQAAGIAALTHAVAWPAPGAAALALAALLLPGRSFLVGAARSLARRRATMDLLVALGAGAAVVTSLLVAAKRLPPTFDHGSAAIDLLLFLRLGKWLEARVRRRAAARLWSLLDALPASARRIGATGTESVAASALEAGDRIEVAPGERVAADGVVVLGRSDLDVSALNGEPLPQPAVAGAAVSAGALVLESPLVVRVTAAGGASQLGQMAAVVRRALVERAPIATFAERVAEWFVPAVIVLAIATATGWLACGAGGAIALGRALATVVVSCPCALALATPAALVAGTSAALRSGIVLKEAAALEALARVEVALLDKTGTLTERRPRAVRLPTAAPLSVLEATQAARLAAATRHAAAQAVAADPEVAAAGAGAVAAMTEERAGLGVRLHDRGREWRLGRPEFAAFAEPGGADAEAAGAADAARAADADGAATDAVAAPPQIVFAVDGIGRAAWTLSDQAKPTAAVAVAELRAQGLAVELVTGDRSGPARAFAASVGIDRLSVRSECTPADKADRVRHHQDEGRPVLFVGDGFNDGSALAVAEVGVACGGASATDLARAAGRVVLQRGDPRDAARAVALGRATLRVIRQNLALSLLYNVVALPWAMGLLARFGATAPAPAHAGLAMAASSLAVVLNALRLARSQRR